MSWTQHASGGPGMFHSITSSEFSGTDKSKRVEENRLIPFSNPNLLEDCIHTEHNSIPQILNALLLVASPSSDHLISEREGDFFDRILDEVASCNDPQIEGNTIFCRLTQRMKLSLPVDSHSRTHLQTQSLVSDWRSSPVRSGIHPSVYFQPPLPDEKFWRERWLTQWLVAIVTDGWRTLAADWSTKACRAQSASSTSYNLYSR